MYNLTPYNHGYHGDPHPQYANKQYKFKNVDGVNNILKLMQIDFVYDANSTTASISDMSGIRKLRLGFDLFNTASDGNQFLGQIDLSAWLTTATASTIPFNGNFRMKMTANWKLQSSNLANRDMAPVIVYAFVEKLSIVDNAGVNKFRLRIYSSTNQYDNLVISPNYLYVDMPIFKDYYYNNPQYAMSNISTNMYEKLDSVINPYINNLGVSLSDVYDNIPNAVVFKSDNTSNVNTRTTIYSGSGGANLSVNLLSGTSLLELRTSDGQTYSISKFIVDDVYQGKTLTIIFESNVTINSIANFTIAGSKDTIYLSGGTTKTFNKGNVINLVYANNIWVQI